MEIKQIEAAIEAVLFAAGVPVELDRLADILELDRITTRSILARMIDDYDYNMRGIHIIRLDNSYQLGTRREYYEYIRRLAEPKRSQSLSSAAMEVLAIVAYKQPITKSTIENIRGVSCDTPVNRLLERNFIEEKGRLEAPGRPILLGTTDEFLRSFGLSSVADLPEFESIDPGDLEFAELRAEADAFDELRAREAVANEGEIAEDTPQSLCDSETGESETSEACDETGEACNETGEVCDETGEACEV